MSEEESRPASASLDGPSKGTDGGNADATLSRETSIACPSEDTSNLGGSASGAVSGASSLENINTEPLKQETADARMCESVEAPQEDPVLRVEGTADVNNTTNEQSKEPSSPRSATMIKPEEEGGFVNHGLVLWEKSRHEWLTINRAEQDNSSARAVATPLDVDDIIDVIFTSSRQLREHGGPRHFPQPVPLPQMVDILQDLWEAEGLDA
jgi:hypothetical protein